MFLDKLIIFFAGESFSQLSNTQLRLLFSISLIAQGNNEGKKRGLKQGPEFTTEQMAALQSKKMALKLDLNENQQKAVHKMMLKSAEERKQFREENRQNRKNGIKPTSEQKFNRENIRLEKQMAHKNEMKKILNEDQYEKWQKDGQHFTKGRKDRH